MGDILSAVAPFVVAEFTDKIYNGYFQLFPRLAIQIPRAFPIVDFSKADAVSGAATLAG